MTIVRAVPAVGRMVGRWLRALGGATSRAIRDLAEPAAIGNTLGSHVGDRTIDPIGGSMIAGAGRRAGETANEGAGDDEAPSP
jgi:hypothetical protein